MRHTPRKAQWIGIQKEDLDLHRFTKGERKDDVFKRRLKSSKPTHGVVFVGVAQEKMSVPRTKRKVQRTGVPDGPRLPAPHETPGGCEMSTI